MPAAAAAPPRAVGRAHLAVAGGSPGTRLQDLRMEGSLKLVFPRAPKGSLQAVSVNTAGGITGGDRFSLAAGVGAGARLTLTTQAAERAYRAAGAEPGQVRTRARVAPGGHLNWLPQETILFDGCNLDRALEVTLAPGATALLAEPVIFGRAAMGERLTCAAFRDRISLIRPDGTPLYLDRIRLSGDIAAQMQGAVRGGGAGAMACVVFASPRAEAMLETVRALLPDTAGASLLPGDLLVARLLAPDGFALRSALIPVLNALSGEPLPRPWMI